ncbi:MAG: hypothetical protein IPK26_10590 [Planctomycetes bacterium]|nr:hypothetical protein [Planctomycetota bacterium]
MTRLRLAAALTALLLPAALPAQNLLTNPSFENGGLSGWNFFGPNVYAEPSNPPAIVPRTGNTLIKMYGHFSGPFNVTGIFQSFPALPGQIFTMDCWTRQWSGDPMIGFGAPNDNWVVMKIAFFNSGGTEIGGAERTVLDGGQVQNVWIDNAPVSGIAPPNTVSVQALILFLQPNNGGGSAQIDDVEFFGPPTGAAYPGTGESVVLSSAVGGGLLSAGAGNDIKLATGNQLLQLNVSSPAGTFDLKPYALVGSLFATGTPPGPQAGFPGIQVNMSSFFVIVNGLVPTPAGQPVIGPNGGSSTYLVMPTFPPGISVMLQGLVVDPIVANGIYAASDAHELRF